jgi:hypothetical protein
MDSDSSGEEEEAAEEQQQQQQFLRSDQVASLAVRAERRATRRLKAENDELKQRLALQQLPQGVVVATPPSAATLRPRMGLLWWITLVLSAACTAACYGKGATAYAACNSICCVLMLRGYNDEGRTPKLALLMSLTWVALTLRAL